MDSKNIAKIGEGCYAEAFSTIFNNQSVVMKVLPCRDISNGEKCGEHTQGIDAVIAELAILKSLSALSTKNHANVTENFVKMVMAKVVIGKHPTSLLKAWDTYRVEEESENIRPSKFNKNQLYLVLILSKGGTALEKFKMESIDQFHSIMQQLVYSLAIAETELQFEHRDLHLGNVLIDKTGAEELEFVLNNRPVRIKLRGVRVTIIDFTWSRIQEGGKTIYVDTEIDTAMFEGFSDSQFDVYREMRRNCQKNWQHFLSESYVLWIRYIATAIIRKHSSSFIEHSEESVQTAMIMINRLGEYRSCRDLCQELNQ